MKAIESYENDTVRKASYPEWNKILLVIRQCAERLEGQLLESGDR